MSSPSKSDWAWFAGVIDGEGHISVVGRRARGAAGALTRRIAITNCNLPLLIRVAEVFGGAIHTHTPPKGSYKQQFQWYCYGDRMRWVLQGVLPRLVAKREEAELCLEFDRVREWQYGHTLTAKALSQYEKLLAYMPILRARQWAKDDVPLAFRSQGRQRGDSVLTGYVRYCPRGHAYDEKNTGRTYKGGRRCRACNRAAEQRRSDLSKIQRRAI